MLEVTRLNGSRFALNPDLIERVHAAPDTTIVMIDGSRYIVAETVAEVIDRAEAQRARVLARALSFGAQSFGAQSFEAQSFGAQSAPEGVR
ncbi:flagellar FlbD family protein [Ruicaihuangia caeni]|uniref:Flagellar FlbD family protein n=1 Tax=Ruicaihuangia caeni TaxID=3042517 RepID=A0AAW6T949_9MICO|nr:flagellar FlbD family protein [Klugiella sp. YN-L-19]MDI2097890.1 flagellar FlbD family protein [Klugiella sp. YN-L-19]